MSEDRSLRGPQPGVANERSRPDRAGLVRTQYRPDWPAIRSTLTTAVRSFLLAATVFTLAAVTGGLLAGAAPADLAPPVPAGQTSPPATSPPPAAPEDAAVHDPGVDAIFARSMIYTGAAALVVAVAGFIMVARRRRSW